MENDGGGDGGILGATMWRWNGGDLGGGDGDIKVKVEMVVEISSWRWRWRRLWNSLSSKVEEQGRARMVEILEANMVTSKVEVDMVVETLSWRWRWRLWNSWSSKVEVTWWRSRGEDGGSNVATFAGGTVQLCRISHQLKVVPSIT